MISPGAREFIEPGLHRMAVRRNQRDRQIGHHKQPQQRPERHRAQNRLQHRRRSNQRVGVPVSVQTVSSSASAPKKRRFYGRSAGM